MKIGFDNEKYLKMQSEHIRERINHFDNKLYLEFGGKLLCCPRITWICSRQQTPIIDAAVRSGGDRNCNQCRRH